MSKTGEYITDTDVRELFARVTRGFCTNYLFAAGCIIHQRKRSNLTFPVVFRIIFIDREKELCRLARLKMA